MPRARILLSLLAVVVLVAAACGKSGDAADADRTVDSQANVNTDESAVPSSDPASTAKVETVPGMPPVVDARNLYSETAAGKMSPAVAGDLPRVYVPHVRGNNVYVIDPATLKVVDKFKVGSNPQHVVPSWDLKTLWVANNAERTPNGSLTPVDPKTGKPG